MPVREEQDVAVGERSSSRTRSTRSPTSSTVSPPARRPRERPARPLLADFGGRPALVGAVVPLHQLVRSTARSPKPASRPVSSARPSGLVSTSPKSRSRRRRRRPRLLSAALGQRDLGAARVPAAATTRFRRGGRGRPRVWRRKVSWGRDRALRLDVLVQAEHVVRVPLALERDEALVLRIPVERRAMSTPTSATSFTYRPAEAKVQFG